MVGRGINIVQVPMRGYNGIRWPSRVQPAHLPLLVRTIEQDLLVTAQAEPCCSSPSIGNATYSKISYSEVWRVCAPQRKIFMPMLRMSSTSLSNSSAAGEGLQKGCRRVIGGFVTGNTSYAIANIDLGAGHSRQRPGYHPGDGLD